jgi:predicted MFS family arabinose efflux permease
MTPRPTSLLTAPFVLAFSAHFLHSTAFYLFLHVPGFLRQLGADEPTIGLYASASAFTAIVLRPAIGAVMDARGRRVVILLGGLLHVVACASYLAVTALGPLILAARVAHGVADAMLFSSLFAYAADHTPEARRIEGIAVFGVSGVLPMSLSALLGDAILARSGYPTLFVWGTVLAALALALSLPLRDGPLAPRNAASRNFVATIPQRALMPVWLLGTLFGAAIASYFTFLKTFVLTMGEGSLSAFYATYTVAAVLLRVVFGGLPERIGVERVLVPALGALAVGLTLLGVAHVAPAACITVAGLLCGIGHGYAVPIVIGLAVDRVPPENRGTTLAICTALFDAGTLVGAPMLGVVVRAWGYPAMFAAAASITAFAGAAFVAMERARRAAGRPADRRAAGS